MSRKKKTGYCSKFLFIILIISGLLIFAYKKDYIDSSLIQEKIEWLQDQVAEKYIDITDGTLNGTSASNNDVDVDSGAGAEITSDISDDDIHYAFAQLDDEEKKVYKELYFYITKMSQGEVSTDDAEVIDKAYRSLMSDYGDLFWVSGYTYTETSVLGTVSKIEVEPTYIMTEDEKNNYQSQVDEKVSQILSGISADASDYDKAKYVFDTLATTIKYNTNAKNNQNILSVFINGETVCQGYAYAAQCLLQELNIPCTTVIGTANGESHAWNLVKLDGNYYYMDTTWGSNSTQTQYANQVNYAYFSMTTAELEMTHQANGLLSLPDCTATEDSYFVKEGSYFESNDTSVYNQFLQNEYNKQTGNISLKFATSELYQEFFEYYITDSHIFEAFGNTSSIQYLEDQNHLVMTFYY